MYTKIKNLALSLSILTALSLEAATLNVTPGTLASQIASGSLNGETTLTLSGTIDIRDIKALESLPSGIVTLDLGNVTITPYSSNTLYFGHSVFQGDELPPYAFFKSPLQKITLPAALTSIPEGAFAESALTTVSLPDGITEIGDYAFYGCSALQNATLPAKLLSIGNKAFFGDSSLSAVSVPASLNHVGAEAFSQTAIKELNLSGVKDFAPYALSGMTKLESLTLGSDIDLPVGMLMDNVSLSSLVGMPADVPDYFAANCNAIDLGVEAAGLVSIGRYAFANNASSEIILDKGIRSLRRGVIAGMAGLKKIDAFALDGDIPEADENAFEGINPARVELYVTDESYADWKAHPVWGQFFITSPSNSEVTEIPVVESGNISIRLQGNTISIISGVAVKDVKIFSADGRLLLAVNPGSEHVELSAADLPHGVTIVRVTNIDNEIKTASILR